LHWERKQGCSLINLGSKRSSGTIKPSSLNSHERINVRMDKKTRKKRSRRRMQEKPVSVLAFTPTII
jgi:hypothetical protein